MIETMEKVMNHLKETEYKNELDKQIKIVEGRIIYHFLKTDGTYDVPKQIPFMHEFLKNVQKLCDVAKKINKEL